MPVPVIPSRGLDDIEATRDCRLELQRAQDRADREALAAWVDRWGGALRELLIAHESPASGFDADEEW